MNRQNPTGPHLNDALSESGGILPVMCDVHRRQAERALKSGEFRSQVCAEFWVQAGKGLVQQQHARLRNNGARECDTLLLSP
jgi:hypothetical protein